MHTPEQIEQWADHANGEMGYADDLTPEWVEFLTRFAALVAQHERERAARIEDEKAEKVNSQWIQLGNTGDRGKPYESLKAADAAVAEQMCVAFKALSKDGETLSNAAAIRNSDGG